MPPFVSYRALLTVSVAASALGVASIKPAAAQTISYFKPGDIVIDTVSGSTLDAASAITLTQFDLSANGRTATGAGTLVLPQTASGANAAFSGEYGSASEGYLNLSANGQYLTMMGYGVNANTFNTAPLSTYGNAALGQTTSLTGGSVTTVPRVVALIGANGSADTSTALTGVFNTNNPRAAATVDGTSFYVSGQGVTGDGTGGVFYATKGATTATAINANTTTPTGTASANAATGTETRDIQIVNTGSGNQLQVSRDFSPSGTPNDSTDIRVLADAATGGLPTSGNIAATRLTNLNTSSGKGGNTLGGNTSSINLTSTLVNGVNNSRVGKFVYLSPEAFYYANATTLYIADSGAPKNGSAGAARLGEGGLQKWTLNAGVWTLAYDLVAGLNLVDNATANSATPTAAGVTGLFGLTGMVVGGQVQLFATSYGLNEMSPSFLYEITDNLADTTITQVNAENGGAGETFATLYSAPLGTAIRGVSFTPAPEPASIAVFGVGLLGAAIARRRRARA